jgi:hypothetical protein
VLRAFLGLLLMGLCLAVPMEAQTKSSYSAQVLAANPDVFLTFSDTSGNFVDQVSGLAFSPSSSGTILYGQSSTLENSTAASLTYDAYLTSPNSTVGNYDWSQPWWAIADVKLNVNLSGSTRVELFSKGVPNHNLTVTDAGGGVGYEAFVIYNGTIAVPCLILTSSTPAGAPSGLSVCSRVPVPNGYGGTIAFTYDGSGQPGGVAIYVNGIWSVGSVAAVGTPTAFSMATPGYPLYLNGDSTNYIASQGGNVHNSAPTVLQAFAMGRGLLSQQTIQSLVVHDRFYAQVLPPPSTPKAVIWDNDGCQDTDNLYSLATAIRLHQLGYIRLALVNSTDWSDFGAAIFRQMLDEGGLHQVPVSASQGTWPAVYQPANVVCTAGNLAGYNATYLPRTRQTADVTGYRTALASAENNSVAIVVGGALRGVYDLMMSPPDSISPLSGAQLFAQKVSEIDMMTIVPGPGDTNLGEDPGDAAYVIAHAGVPFYFYGSNVTFGDAGPGVNFTRTQQYPFVATLEYVNALTRASWDMWPLLGVLDRDAFWSSGLAGTATVTNGGASTFTYSPNGQQYVMSTLPAWSGQNVWLGSWFLNSLIDAAPEPPVVP